MIDVLDSSLPYVIGILASTYAQLLNKCTFQFDEVSSMFMLLFIFKFVIPLTSRYVSQYRNTLCLAL